MDLGCRTGWPSEVLAKVRRVLRTGGKFFILDATADGPIVSLMEGGCEGRTFHL